MKKSETIMELKKQGVVAVVRGHSLSEELKFLKLVLKVD